MTKNEYHELEARRNALDIALRQTLPQAVEDMETVLISLLAAQDTKTIQQMDTAIKAAGIKSADDTGIVPLLSMASKGGDIKSAKTQRRMWREEFNQIQAQLDACDFEGLE